MSIIAMPILYLLNVTHTTNWYLETYKNRKRDNYFVYRKQDSIITNTYYVRAE